MAVADPGSEMDEVYWNAHWQRYAEATRLNPGQRYRRRLIQRLLGDGARADGTTILDVGCGAGDLLEAVAAAYPEARLGGIDQSAGGIAICQRLLPAAHLATLDISAPDFDAGPLTNWASHVVCSEVLEHIEQPVPVLKNLAQFMKADGRLIITVPGGPRSAFDRSIGHFRHYTPASLRADLLAAGYRTELVTGSGFPLFNLYRLVVVLRGERLAQDIDGRPGPLARFVMAIFRAVIGWSLFSSRFGWQIVAIARKADA
ncbi:MAG: class I SAM-dependent methyltransferase [Rhodospirillales bacterium]|nr:class I SAM-dependent methyltransferase [Rhodospirillales bacterium]